MNSTTKHLTPAQRDRLAAELERSAKSAFADGLSYSDWAILHDDDLPLVEPWDRHARHRLRMKLMGLVLAGNRDGAEPIDDPWGRDDAEQTQTQEG